MRKAREVLRLHYEARPGQREIARSLGLSQSTVHTYLERAKAAQLEWPLPAEISENGLRGLLYPKKRASAIPEPDWAEVRLRIFTIPISENTQAGADDVSRRVGAIDRLQRSAANRDGAGRERDERAAAMAEL